MAEDIEHFVNAPQTSVFIFREFCLGGLDYIVSFRPSWATEQALVSKQINEQKSRIDLCTVCKVYVIK